jgi:hypothetical protein
VQGVGEDLIRPDSAVRLGGALRVRAAVVVLALVVASSAGSVAVANQSDPAWTPRAFWESTEKGLNSVLLFDAPSGNGSFLYRLENNNYSEPYWAFGSDGGACEAASQVFCVESLSVERGGKSEAAIFEKQLVSTELEGVPNTPIPKSIGSSLWRLPGESGTTDHFIVSARIDGQFLEKSRKFASNATLFQASIDQVENKPTNPISRLDYQSCLIWIASSDECFPVLNMPLDRTLILKVRLPKFLGGWYFSRVAGLQSKVDSSFSDYNLWTFAGTPSLLSAISYAYPPAGNEGLTAKIYRIYESDSSNVRRWDGLSHNVSGWFGGANDVVSALQPVLSDRATADYTRWSIASYNYYQSNKCFEGFDKIHGFVSTNAMAYSPQPPEFKDGFFSYKVSNLHRHASGQVVNGYFTFVIDSETARCLYGFSNAPISAKVTVVGELGAEQVSTTIVSERDGWLTLTASGFTYSEKEIQIRLSQPPVSQPTQSVQVRPSHTSTTSKFPSNGFRLSALQKSEVRRAISATSGRERFVCTGTYSSPPSRSIALARARAVCNFAKTIAGNRKYLVEAKRVSSSRQASTVVMTSK